MSRHISVKNAAFASVFCISSFPVLFAQSPLENSVAASRRLTNVGQTKIRVNVRGARSLATPDRSSALAIKPVTIVYAARGPQPSASELPRVTRTVSGATESVTIYYRVPKARKTEPLSVAAESPPVAETVPETGATVPIVPQVTEVTVPTAVQEIAPAAPVAKPEEPKAEPQDTTSQPATAEEAKAQSQDTTSQPATVEEAKAEPQDKTSQPATVEKAKVEASPIPAPPLVEPTVAANAAPLESDAAAISTTTANLVPAEPSAPVTVAEAPATNEAATDTATIAEPVSTDVHPAVVALPKSLNEVLQLNETAIRLAKELRYEEASEMLRKAVAAAPDEFKLHRNLSIVYESMKKFGEALAEARAAAELAPNEPSALMQLCGLQLLTKNDAEAVTCYERLVKLQQPDTLTVTFYGVALLRTGDAQKALPVLEKALASDPNNSAALNAVGVTYFQLKRFSDAVDAFKTAIESDPDRLEIRLNLGIAQLARGNREGALSQYRVLKTENPELADRLFKALFQDKVVTVDQLQGR